MPVIKKTWITRDDLKRNRDHIFVFGDNVIRKGYGGQAKAMRGEPNANGIATKRAPSRRPDAFFRDDTYEENCSIIAQDFAPVFEGLKAGKTIVFPENGIGTDRAQIHKTAPRTAAFLDALIEKLMTFDPAPMNADKPRVLVRPRASGRPRARTSPPSPQIFRP